MKGLDECQSIGTDWVALYANAENVTDFDSFGVKHIPKESRNKNNEKIFYFIGNKNNVANIYGMQE